MNHLRWSIAVLVAIELLTSALAQDGTLAWNFGTGAKVISSPAIAQDGTVYVGSNNNKLHAINPGGIQKWTFETGGDVQSSPTIGADGTVYVGSGDGSLYAVNSDGTQKWAFATQDAVLSSPAIDQDGTIYVGSDDGNVYAVNPEGTRKWAFATQGAVFSSPVIGADGTVYVGSFDRKLYAINLHGTQKWAFVTGGRVFSSPAVDEDGTVYVGSFDGNVYAINPDGTQKWALDPGLGTNQFYSSPAIGADGTIYVGRLGGAVFAVNADGSQKWTFGAGLSVFSSPAIDRNGTVYVGSHNSKLHAINPDGTEKWSFTAGAEVQSSPAIGADGKVYVGSWDGNLYAVSGNSGGLADSSWPMFRRDLRHTGNVASFDDSQMSLVYAATGDGALKSTDGGQSWNDSGLAGIEIRSLAIDRADSTTLYAGTLGQGLFKSVDEGASWSDSSSGLTDTIILSLAVDPAETNTLYAGTASGPFLSGNGVFKSTDAGESWAVRNQGLTGLTPRLEVRSLAIDPSNTDILYAGTLLNGVFKSSDGGISWVAANSNIADVTVNALIIDPTGPMTVYAGTVGGVFKSTDGGQSWADRNLGLSDLTPNLDIRTLALDPSNTNVLYAGTFLNGVFKSSSGGSSWVAANSDMVNITVNVLTIDPASPARLYAGTDGKGVFKSTTGGQSWSSVGPDGTTVFSLVVSELIDSEAPTPEPDNKLYFAQFGNGAGFTSDIVTTNPSVTDTVSGRVDFFGDDGLPLQVGIVAVNTNGPLSREISPSDLSSSVDLSVPPLGAVIISTDGQGDVVVGSAVVDSDDTVGGIIRFSIPGIGLAGVGASQPLATFLAPVESASGGINTGIAIHNVETQAVTLNVTLRNLQGQTVPDGTRAIESFPAAGHLAHFIHELFPDADTDNFQGTLGVEVIGGRVAATALELGGKAGEFTTLPVIAAGPLPPTDELFFAQFADGFGFTSSLFLINPSGAVLTGEISFFDDNGQPLPISVAGQAAAERVGFDLPAQGGVILATDGKGDLATGSARVTASGPVGGVLKFASPGLGIAGVGASRPMSGFITPVTRSAAQSTSTGVAITSIASAVTANLTLRNLEGEPIAGGQATLELPAKGHTARFIEELFPDADTDDFRGTLVVEVTAGEVAATALELGGQPGQFTTLPVTPLQ